MLLALLVAGYGVLGLGSLWAAVQSFRNPMGMWGRHRLWVRLLVAVEAVYLLQAPAFVYLFRVPGKPAIQREIVGVDASQRVHWLETERRLGFAWGPRWWIAISGHVLDGGTEFLPPVRFAQPRPFSARLIRSDGTRRPVSIDTGELWARRRWFVSDDGTLFGRGPGGLYRVLSSETIWRLLTPTEPWLQDWSLEAFCGVVGGSVEAYEAFQALATPRGRRALLLVERDQEGRVVRKSALSLEEESVDVIGSRGRSLEMGATADGMHLFQTWVAKGLTGRGRVYRLSNDLSQVEELGTFDFDPMADLSIAVSKDGALFSTGQAIFRTSGERVTGLDPALKSCRWVGHTLVGVRSCALFAAIVKNRAVPFARYVDVARTPASATERAVDQSLLTARRALQRRPWVIGGIDEAGCEDEIVQVSVQ